MGYRRLAGVRAEKEGIGSAGVFAFDGKEFTQLGDWIEADTIGDAFGDVVAINQDGSRIAVGASLYDMDGYPNPNPNPDQEYYDDWGEYNPTPTCYSDDDDDENANFGLVRAYEFADGDWSQMGVDMLGVVCDKFGSTIDMDTDGARIVVGAPEDVTDHDTLERWTIDNVFLEYVVEKEESNHDNHYCYFHHYHCY